MTTISGVMVLSSDRTNYSGYNYMSNAVDSVDPRPGHTDHRNTG